MKKAIYIIIFIITFNGCNSEQKKNLKKDSQKNTEVFSEDIRIPKLKNIIREIPDSLKSRFSTDLFNKNLTSLSIRDENKKNVYEKFEIDFNHICYPSALSIFIDCINSKIYAFEFDDEIDSITDENIEYIFNIKSIIYKNGEYIIVCDEIESFIGGDYTKTKFINLELNFSKLESTLIYILDFKENKLNVKYKDIFGGYEFYVKKEIEDNFHKDNCDDFDG